MQVSDVSSALRDSPWVGFPVGLPLTLALSASGERGPGGACSLAAV
jgi:hypothetical protein